jgi:TRAP-type C4-dicarboxylate transport system permease small subunit
MSEPEHESQRLPSQPSRPELADRTIAPVRLILRWLGVLLLVVMIAMPAVQVVLREFLRAPFVGAEELTRFMLICVVFVTLPFVISSGASIRMEEILQGLPTRLRHGLRIAIAGTAALAFATAAYSVGIATLSNLHNATPTLGIPYWVFFSAAFMGLLLAAVECAIQLVKIVRGRDQYVHDETDTPPGDEPTLGGY